MPSARIRRAPKASSTGDASAQSRSRCRARGARCAVPRRPGLLQADPRALRRPRTRPCARRAARAPRSQSGARAGRSGRGIRPRRRTAARRRSPDPRWPRSTASRCAVVRRSRILRGRRRSGSNPGASYPRPRPPARDRRRAIARAPRSARRAPRAEDARDHDSRPAPPAGNRRTRARRRGRQPRASRASPPRARPGAHRRPPRASRPRPSARGRGVSSTRQATRRASTALCAQEFGERERLVLDALGDVARRRVRACGR